MNLILILPILVSGFIYCNKHPLVFSRLHRYEGQFLYLQCAKYGLLFLALSLLLNFTIIDFILPKLKIEFNYISMFSSYIESQNLQIKSPSQASWIVALSISMIIIPIIYCKLYTCYQLFNNNLDSYGRLLSKIQFSIAINPLENMLLESLFVKKKLLLTMKDRKVYVGIVTMISAPTEATKLVREIRIKPMLSGFRDKDNLTIEFTTDYEKVSKSLSLSLNQDDISSISFFDFDVFEEFQTHRKIKQPEKTKSPYELSSIKTSVKNKIQSYFKNHT